MTGGAALAVAATASTARAVGRAAGALDEDDEQVRFAKRDLIRPRLDNPFRVVAVYSIHIENDRRRGRDAVLCFGEGNFIPRQVFGEARS